MTDHTVKSFDEDLISLDFVIRDMALLAAEMVEEATSNLAEAGAGNIARLEELDLRMDAMQREVDDRAVRLIATRQPMAQDLRAVVCSIRIASEFERIGDLARNITRRSIEAGEVPELHAIGGRLEEIARLAHAQLEAMVALYTARDPQGLDSLRDRDEQIDMAYVTVLRELLRIMSDAPAITVSGSHLLFCAKNLERIGDHVTNIAEDTYFMLTGRQLPPNRPKRNEFGSDMSI